MQALLEPNGYVAMGNGTKLTTAPFRCEEGGHQDVVETGFLFVLGVNEAFSNFNRRLKDVGGGVTAIIDDN